MKTACTKMNETITKGKKKGKEEMKSFSVEERKTNSMKEKGKHHAEK